MKMVCRYVLVNMFFAIIADSSKMLCLFTARASKTEAKHFEVEDMAIERFNVVTHDA